MKLLLITVLSVFFLASCSHHHQKGSHHHHDCEDNCVINHEDVEMFDMHCSMSVSEGDLHVKGSKDFMFKHGGEVYYFSSEEKLNQFKKNIDENVKSAQQNWDRNVGRK